MAAGDLASTLGVPASTLSHHLALLENAGLLEAVRDQRHIFYRVDASASRAFVAFIVNDLLLNLPDYTGLTPRDIVAERWDRPSRRPRPTRIK